MTNPPVATPSPRRTPSDLSDWSDPRESDVKGYALSSSGRKEGCSIPVPSFLQPLLGLDFVPYQPKPGDESDDENSVGIRLEVALSTPEAPRSSYPNEIPNSTSSLSFESETPEGYPSNDRSSPHRKSYLQQKRQDIREKAANILAIQAQRQDRTPRRSNSKKTRANNDDYRWMKKEHDRIEESQGHLEAIQTRSASLRQRAASIDDSILKIQSEIESLSESLTRALNRLEDSVFKLEYTEQELVVLEHEAINTSKELKKCLDTIQENSGHEKTSGRKSSFFKKPPRLSSRQRSAMEEVKSTLMEETELAVDTSMPAALPRERSASDPKPVMKHSSSSSFMRVGDLDISSDDMDASSVSTFNSTTPPSSRPLESRLSTEDFFFIDQNLPLILDKLVKLGYQVVTDESDRFSPVSGTQKIIDKQGCQLRFPTEGWPICPWFVAPDKDVLLWTGSVPHKGFGHDWPVVKARGFVNTSPRQLADFLLDSSQIKKYNRMSKGREDTLVLQSGLDTAAEASTYSIAGEVKITRAINKHRMLPKAMEMLSLWYAKPLEEAPDSYLIVNRSVWEDGSGTPKSNQHLRSEMLLGVHLIRPRKQGSELTSITHVYAPGVPEILAKRKAPTSAADMIRDIQKVFS